MQIKNKAHTAVIAGSILAAAAIMPVAANASGSLVTLVDSATSSQARVLNGRLAVNTADGYSNALLYRTPVGGVSQAAGTHKALANVSTAAYKKLRIVADERVGSPTNVSFRVTILEGSELVAQLATFTLTPHNQTTFTIDLPARAVAIYADTAAGSGSDAYDFLVYGDK